MSSGLPSAAIACERERKKFSPRTNPKGPDFGMLYPTTYKKTQVTRSYAITAHKLRYGYTYIGIITEKSARKR